jgi:hypothetical protein
MTKFAILLIGAALLAPTIFGQQSEEAKEERFSGIAMGTGGAVSGRTVQFDFRVTHYATDDEVQALATLLKEKGQDALRSAMEKLDAGRINPVGSVGNQIAVARKRQEGPNTIITIVTARNMSFAELYNGGRSRNHPFGFLQVTLDKEKREGTGKIIALARLGCNKKKGHYEIENYGNQYLRAVNVRPQ